MISITTNILGFTPSASMLLDIAAKGSALLLLAAGTSMLLKRGSAAARHLVWLLAILALLLLPAFSATLPQWHVLPQWAGVSRQPAPVAVPANLPVLSPMPQTPAPIAAERVSISTPEPIANPAEVKPIAPAPATVSTSTTASDWLALVPFLWMTGVAVLMLRLLAARLFLWSHQRPAAVVGTTTDHTKDPLLSALTSAARQLGITRPITLLVHPANAIPIVWGLFRQRLLLPGAARHWPEAQLRSVLLHELAHVRRGDIGAQLVTQLACALHWFNPLAWVAAWRLGVERELACDDLVISSGVRPSAYAGHLLDIVSNLSPGRLAQACGLAMARKSSIEHRLLAVLNGNLNRRGVSAALGILALAIAFGIAIPVAMLRAAESKPAAPAAAPATPAPAPALKPSNEQAQELFAKWKSAARTDGRIPGALIGHLLKEVDGYIKQYPADEHTPKFVALRPRLDASHDWAPADVVALLNDITAIATAPVGWTNLRGDFDAMGNFKPGRPLPAELTNVAWGTPADNGLRVAWVFEPQAKSYHLGTVLKARVLFHNTGTQPVIFKTDAWHQYDHHTAKDANGKEIKVNATRYSGITPTTVFRLAPGEYCEVPGHGIAIGAGPYVDEFSAGAVGAIIEAKVSDEVRLTESVTINREGWTRPNDPKDPAALWNLRIAERVQREGPMPAAPADRELIVRRVTLDIFGVQATADDIAAFVADNSPDALGTLTKRLQARPRLEEWTGTLATGDTRFTVLAADPDAAKAPRVAGSPGRYVLADNVVLLVSQITTEGRRANKATIAFLSPDPKVESKHKPVDIELPDGLSAFAAVWERGAGTLWIAQKGLIRKFDYTDPENVKITPFENGTIGDVPEKLRQPLQKVFAVPEAAPKANAAPKASADKIEANDRLAWGQPVDGLRAAIALLPPKAGDAPDIYIVVQNVSDKPIRLNDTLAEQQPRMIHIKSDGRIQAGLGAKDPRLGDITLQPREAVRFLMYLPGDMANGQTIGQMIAGDFLKDTHQSMVATILIEKAPPGAWTGKLVTGDTSASVAVGQPQPKTKQAQVLYKLWQHNARKNGNIPGGFIGRLGENVKEFVRANANDTAGSPYAKKMEPLIHRFDASHDWTLAAAVALLDDIAAVSDGPIWVACEESNAITLHTGTPLPKELASVPWGEPVGAGLGLRAAFVLEPQAAEYHIGTPLKARLLIHNAGKDVVVFRTRGWHQLGHTARDVNGALVKTDSTEWLTRGVLTPFRLWPGEYVSLYTPGIGIGPMKNSDDWQNTSVGTWIDAQPGDEVTLTTGPLPLYDWNEETQFPVDGELPFWRNLITARLSRELPIPANPAERERLVYRAGMDLFGTPIEKALIDAFVADKSPDPLAALVSRLMNRPGTQAWAGPLVPGTSKFKILARDTRRR